MQQRPMQQRPMQQRPMQHHMQCHPMHITHNFVARPSHTLQMMRSNAIRPHPSANMPSPFVHTNLAGPRTSQNMQLLPMRSHLAGPRTLQNTHNFVMPRNSFVVSRPSQSNNVARPSQSNNMARPSQPSAMVRPAQTFQPSRQTSNDTAPYPVQKQTSNDTPSYSTQRQTSNNTVQYPVQKQMTNDTVSHSTQRQTSDDAVSCQTQKTQQDLMRSYSAPIPQQESTANHDSSQRLSVAGPETSRRIVLSHKVNDQNTPVRNFSFLLRQLNSVNGQAFIVLTNLFMSRHCSRVFNFFRLCHFWWELFSRDRLTQNTDQFASRRAVRIKPVCDVSVVCLRFLSHPLSMSLHLFRIQCKNVAWLSKESPEELEPTPPRSVVLHRRIPSAHVAPSRPRATVTKSRLFTRAVNQAVTVCGQCVLLLLRQSRAVCFGFVSSFFNLSVPFAFCLCR